MRLEHENIESSTVQLLLLLVSIVIVELPHLEGLRVRIVLKEGGDIRGADPAASSSQGGLGFHLGGFGLGKFLRLNVLLALGLGLVLRGILLDWEVDALETLSVVLILSHDQRELLTV